MEPIKVFDDTKSDTLIFTHIDPTPLETKIAVVGEGQKKGGRDARRDRRNHQTVDLNAAYKTTRGWLFDCFFVPPVPGEINQFDYNFFLAGEVWFEKLGYQGKHRFSHV